ncbi:HAD-superfamily subfamily IIA hydrolase like protein [Methylocella silvestris BL2]|uniref:Haloacid dehalogenase-like hydrolase domain-containing protein 2 n=1 Tax=Methylocella silvestris (strain DSM 15510 / CIP 108128 / LMG 27833 / NCIMB 13906 / BL2) TaxID=395965 RepID=B8ELH5_METSB|nr:TIGR01458 family HAD-type hydrolase [Methylocella silvestris]ACK49564.1 HAD-superfamily subfamily IIA hydrolase like protein [Methylocella silvestris BL2]
MPPAQSLIAKTPAGVLLDIDGVICVGARPIAGSIEAVRRLRERDIPVRFVTNTTRRPRRRILEDLRRLPLEIADGEIFTPARIARDLLTERGLAPLLIVHPDLGEDFTGLPQQGQTAVVVGDAGEAFSYQSLNGAFRALLHGAEFFALANNRNFLDSDGDLSLDAGPFVAALEFASGKKPLVLGKPAPAFFKLAVESMGLDMEDVAMIGDDAESDVGGAMAAGLMGVLVRTGKYRPGQEERLAEPPTSIEDDLSAAVAKLFG